MAQANKIYFSDDIEASGPSPGKYSMLSFGACIVGNTKVQIYRELKPISSKYDEQAMRVGCLGLRCLEPYKKDPVFNPKSRKFTPEMVLEVLEEKGTSPADAMNDFAEFIYKNSIGKLVVELAKPVKFDGGFINYYFHEFYGSNPFGHSGMDLGAVYKGLKKDLNENVENLKIKDTRNPAHNSLEDAIHQAKQAEEVFKLMSKNLPAEKFETAFQKLISKKR